MKPWVQLEESLTPDGTVLSLWQRGAEMVIRADGQSLMGNRCQASEVALAQLALAQYAEAGQVDGSLPESSAPPPRSAPRVLVGGLGFGYTLRATLDALPADSEVVVAELSEAVVQWNRGPLKDFAGHPLADRRVQVHRGDIVALLRSPKANFNVILLDVDNGPGAFTQAGNGWLYSQGGLVRISRVLSPGGVLAVWSAGVDGAFTGQLRASGYSAREHRVRARINAQGEGKGERHMIWTATPLRKVKARSEPPASGEQLLVQSAGPRDPALPPRRPSRRRR